MAMRQLKRLRRLVVIPIAFSLIVQTLAPVLPTGSAGRSVEAATAPLATARQVTDAEFQATNPATLAIGAGGFQPPVVEVPVGQTLSIVNNDSRTRMLAIGTDPAGPTTSRRVFLPVLTRAAGGAAVRPAPGVAPRVNETVTLQPGETIQRTYSEVGNLIVTDTENPSLTATITVTPAPIEKVGNLSGTLTNYQTKQPVAGAKIKAIDTAHEATTDATGKYSLPLPPGEYTLAFFANGFTFANRKLSVQSFNDTLIDTIELVPLDPKVDPVTPAGGTASNSTGNTNINFAAGAVDATKAVRLTHLPTDEMKGDYAALPGPFVDGQIPLGFVLFEPDGATFNADALWTIDYDGPLPVGYNWDDGLYCYYWVEKEARWSEPVPAEVIDLGDGKKGLRANLPHFSSYGFAAPPPVKGPDAPQNPGDPGSPAGKDDNPNANGPCGKQKGAGSTICFMGGELGQTVGTLALPSAGGLPTQIAANYQSLSFDTSTVISTSFRVQPGARVPDQAEWWFKIAGREFKGTGREIDLTWDGLDANGNPLPPGAHQGELGTRWIFDTPTGWSEFTKPISWTVQVKSPHLSPFGRGWFSGHDTLLIDRGNVVTIVQGDGRDTNFEKTATGYTPAKGDFSTLTKNADGAYTRAFRDGSAQSFNGDGRLTKISERHGNFQAITYESNGQTVPAGSWGLTTRIKRVTDTSGNSFDFRYDANGWLAAIADNVGRTYSYGHDAAGNLVSATDPLGQRESFTYDARGLMTGHTDKRGNQTTYVLDDQGRVVSRTWPTGSTLKLSYTPNQTIVETDRGTPIVTTMDEFFNPTARYNGVYTATTSYNSQLQPERSSTPPQTTLYDQFGNAIAVLDGTATRLERAGPFDQVSRVRANDGTNTQFGHDAQGNVTSYTDALGQRHDLTYNAAGQPLTIKDPLGQVTSFQYDSRGLVSRVIDPLGRAFQLSHDAAGNLTGTRDPLGRNAASEYDALGRLTALVDNLNGRTALEYDPNGNLTKVVDPTGRAVSYGHDTLGRRTSVTYPDGSQDTFQYDPSGNLSGVVDARGKTIGWQRDVAGRPTRKEVPDGPAVTYTYDALDQLTHSNDGTISTTIGYLPDTSGFPSRIQQSATGFALATTVDYDYGAGSRPDAAGSGGLSVSGLPQGNRTTVTAPEVITQNTTWTADHVYVIPNRSEFSGERAGLTIAPGATLTLQPGVIVKASYTWVRYWLQTPLVVQGALIAEGTASQPIIFTSSSDDAWGGDTNGDGPTTGESGAGWPGISFQTGSQGRLSQAFIGYAGNGLSAATSDLTVDRVTFQKNSDRGLILDNAGATVTGSSFLGNGTGFHVVRTVETSSPLLVTNNLFQGNGSAGRFTLGGTPAGTMTFRGNVSPGPGRAVHIVGDLGGDLNWENGANLPFLIPAPVYASASWRVMPGVSLTLGPGSVVKGADRGSCNPCGTPIIQVQGTLNALGTPSAPVAFTAARDFLRGGDLDGDRTGVAGGGGWHGIHYQAGSRGRVEHAFVGYSEFGIHTDSSDVAIADVTFESNRDYWSRGALRAGGTAQLTASNLNFSNNGTAVWAVDETSAITVTNSYFGSSSGPTHPSNPGGAGEGVSGRVTFLPFSAAFVVPSGGRMTGVRLVSNDNRAQEQRYSYDAIGQATRIGSTGYATYTLDYRYDAAGRLTARTPAGGAPLSSDFGYDAASQLTSLALRHAGGALLDEGYTLDAAGNLTQVVSSRDGTTTYGYDALNRLTNAGGPHFSAAYEYDAAGNRTKAGSVSYTYDAAGRLTAASDGASYGYDAAGNLTSMTRSGQTSTYTWDSQNRLTRIDYPDGASSAYGYDDQGRRISKRLPDGATTYFVYSGDLLLQEVDAGGSVLASYAYDGLDRPVSMWRGGQTYFYLLDRLGSVLGLVDAGGALVATYQYDPWGNLLASTGTLANPLRFTAREYDAESGLYFYRARYYDPRVGRFISRDPIGITGGLNLYAYVENNPLSARDPSGLAYDSANKGQAAIDAYLFNKRQNEIKTEQIHAKAAADAEAVNIGKQKANLKLPQLPKFNPFKFGVAGPTAIGLLGDLATPAVEGYMGLGYLAGGVIAVLTCQGTWEDLYQTMDDTVNRINDRKKPPEVIA